MVSEHEGAALRRCSKKNLSVHRKDSVKGNLLPRSGLHLTGRGEGADASLPSPSGSVLLAPKVPSEARAHFSSRVVFPLSELLRFCNGFSTTTCWLPAPQILSPQRKPGSVPLYPCDFYTPLTTKRVWVTYVHIRHGWLTAAAITGDVELAAQLAEG